MKIIDQLLDRFANSLYSRAFNNGINLDKEVEWIDREKTERLLRDRIGELEEQLHNYKQAYYTEASERRRLNALLNPQPEENEDETERTDV